MSAPCSLANRSKRARLHLARGSDEAYGGRGPRVDQNQNQSSLFPEVGHFTAHFRGSLFMKYTQRDILGVSLSGTGEILAIFKKGFIQGSIQFT